MNILFVCEVDYLRKVVFDVHWLAESMALLGHRVYVIDYESMWGLDDKRISKETLVSRAFPNAVVHLVRPSFVRVPILSRASAFVSHYYGIRGVIQKKYIDAIVLYSVPTNGLQAVHWAKRFNIPVVFRSIDILNQLVPYPILRPVTEFLEKWVYSSVDRILTITPKLSEYVVRMGAKLENVDVLPIPVDMNLFHPSDDVGDLRQKWGLSDGDRVVLYMGTLFNFCGLDGFIPKFKYILNEFPKAKLLIVGDGEQRRELDSIIRTVGLGKSVIITGFQPYQDIPQYINLSDVCINPFVDAEVTRDIFPGKTVQFLACGKPLVMSPLDGVKVVISGEEQGVVYADNIEMATAVISLLDDAERREEIGRNGLKYAIRHHDSRQVAKQLEAELLGLAKEKEWNAQV